MSQDILEKNFVELLIVIEKCFGDKYFLPGLMLLYAHIDIAAALNRPASKSEVTRQDFKNWVDEYLLPNSNLSCTADDLYAARCGLLHTYMAESKSSREGKAKQIFYAWGTADDAILQGRLHSKGLDSIALVIHVDVLFNAFRAGIDCFMGSLTSDQQKAQLVYERARKYFRNIPKSLLESSKPGEA
jgi:hypothetical protein